VTQNDDVSRRDFLARTTTAGLALSLFGPGIARALPMADGGLGDSFAAASDGLAPLFSGLRWRMLGPFRGGRVDAVCGVVGRPNEFYFGHVNGGVWKSIDAGRVWTPIFDAQPVASIGALAVAPSAPDTIYVGSGESTLRDSVGFGNGVYKSTNAGKSWTHLGLDDTQHIGKIAIDPRNPDVVFVAAIGHLYAPNADRGVFKSVDGGKSWRKVLFKNNDVGAVDVVIDPTSSRVVYACLWNTRRPPWYTYAPTNGPGGGIFKSTDGGTTWKQLTNGLPKEAIGRSGIVVAPSNPRRLYAVVDCLVPDPNAPPPPPPPPAGAAGRGGAQASQGQGGFFRSDDAGASWTKMSGDQALWGRGWYFEKLAVDPKDADTVYVPNVSVSRTRDGGKTWVALRGSPGGDDYHQAWVSPDDPNTMIVASDQGAIITRKARTDDPREVTWSSWLNQPTAQIYHLSVDRRFPYWVTGAQQDSGAVAVRSRGKFAEISMRDWEPIGAGGESGMTATDPLNPGVIFGGISTRWNLETNTAVRGTTAPQSPEQARADWTQPLVFSQADQHALYYANQYLFKTTDAAKTWTRISDDLTRPDPGVPTTLDATAAAQVDRNGKRGVIYAVAPSPVRAPLLWIGTDDGFIQLTQDDGKTWQNVTPNAITAWSRVTMLEASHFDPNAAYASVDRHQLQDFDPYIYRTRDLGRSWQKITNGLPAGVYVHSIKEDPQRRGLLVCGTERGAFLSFDDGDSWQPLQLNLPVTSVRDFEFYENDLVVATHGRGFWVIDDISALRQATDDVAKADVYLFKPADAINVQQGGDNGTPLQKDEPQAANAPNAAYIDYYLRAPSAEPVTVEVLDSAGAVVATYSSDPTRQPQPAGRGFGGGRPGGIPNTSPLWRQAPEPMSAAAGMHRVAWNLSPAGGFGARADTPPIVGSYTVRLTAGGRTLTQPITVRPDPRR
jgi:photosystem II stability/assembly factor-like uncharacterized protein